MTGLYDTMVNEWRRATEAVSTIQSGKESRMKKWKIGVLGTADIAFRRMIPAILNTNQLEYYGVAVAFDSERTKGNHSDTDSDTGYGTEMSSGTDNPINSSKLKKAEQFKEAFGGRIIAGYESLLQDKEVDAVYLPLPPSIHEYWAKKALEHGKHVFVEKPCTIRKEGTEMLLKLAEEKGLALYENYAFCHHNQIRQIKTVLESGRLGELRLIRASFGFPYRGAEDFRYKKALGGGALFDCGGYTLKAAQLFLGNKLEVKAASLSGDERHDVDLFGNVTLQSAEGLCAQLAFGMDNVYQCSLELIGSKACLTAGRIFSPPADFEAQLLIRSQGEETITVPKDDQFLKAAEDFGKCISCGDRRREAGEEILRQSGLVQEVFRVAENSLAVKR